MTAQGFVVPAGGGKHFPAMTLVQVSALIDPHAKVEIEADAVLP